jgi:hypothetical protein
VGLAHEIAALGNIGVHIGAGTVLHEGNLEALGHGSTSLADHVVFRPRIALSMVDGVKSDIPTTRNSDSAH